ncbi:cell division control protein 14 [Tulasnella sp. 418]|nr:cell division control protein 14 [Tulasnella sp. 418]
MPLQCEPLVQFSERLYFTTFPAPAPAQSVLNSSKNQLKPRVRSKLRTHGQQIPTPDDHAAYYYFTVDDDLPYLSFFEDWGPLNLGQVYKACILMHELLEDHRLASHRLVLYSSNDPRRKANAALLMALFVMIVQRRQPWEAFHPIAEMEFMPFRDAGRGRSDFNLSIQDCLWGFWKATHFGLCDLNEFSLEDYEYYEKVENGDWNWVTPHFIAFASPVDTVWMKNGGPHQAQNGSELCQGQNNRPLATHNRSQSTSRAGSNGPLASSISSSSSSTSSSLQKKLPTPFLNCLEYFNAKNVKLIIRLNNPLYDKNTFLERGMDHMELYFDDGTNPTDEIVRKFIDVSEQVIESGGVVAVHCKAGLGRTGTLIGAYLIYKYGFTANEAIAFMRIVRPGCVVGPQQQYMYTRQLEWIKWAAVDEGRKTEEANRMARMNSNGTVTPPMDEDVPTTPTPANQNLPPVTPPRQTATSSALPDVPSTLPPPGQPRKTPSTKRVLSDMEVDSDEENKMMMVDEDEEEVEEEVAPLRPIALPVQRPASAAAVSLKTGGTTAPGIRGRMIPPRSLRNPPASERTNRTTRSSTRAAATTAPTTKRGVVTNASNTTATVPTTRAKAAAAAAPPPSPTKAGLKNAGSVAPRIPRTNINGGPQLYAQRRPPPGPTTSVSTRSMGRPVSPSPVGSSKTVNGNSRLPTLVPSKRGYTTAAAGGPPVHANSESNAANLTVKGRTVSGRRKSSGAFKVGIAEEEEEPEPDAWMSGEAAENIVTKGDRPLLRNVRRRRSSFSAADVIA